MTLAVGERSALAVGVGQASSAPALPHALAGAHQVGPYVLEAACVQAFVATCQHVSSQAGPWSKESVQPARRRVGADLAP